MGSNFSKIIDVFPPHHCINTPDCSRPAVLQNCFYGGAHTHWWSVNQVRLITVLYSLNSNEISKEGFSLSVGLINNISVISHVFFTTSYVRMLFSYNYVLTHNRRIERVCTFFFTQLKFKNNSKQVRRGVLGSSEHQSKDKNQTKQMKKIYNNTEGSAEWWRPRACGCVCSSLCFF